MKIYDGKNDLQAVPTKHTVRVTSSGHLLCDGQDRMTLRHAGREDYSLFFCETGCVSFDGTPLHAGELWIYPPHVPQKYTVLAKDGTAYFYLHFTGCDVPALFSSLDISLMHPLRVKQPQITASLLTDIQKALFAGGVKGELLAEARTLKLLAALALEEQSLTPSHTLRHVTDRMTHAFAEEYRPAVYAQMLGISESRFAHLFREAVGVSPYAYLLSLRIENAKALLCETKLKVQEIAALCGFPDPLYFAQAFRKRTGLSPSTYRKTHIEEYVK